jgi:hypothetical protein
MLSQVQNFINQISICIGDKKNPLGLSPGQIDEINQILTLIKNLISDGIQRNDVIKMVALLGEIAEAVPELQSEIKDVIVGLKKLAKKLFESEDINTMNPSTILGLETLVQGTDDETDDDTNIISDDAIISNLSQQKRPQDIILDQNILEKTYNDRLKIAEDILTLINDNVILSKSNFDILTRGLTAIKNRSILTDNRISDRPIDPVYPNNPLV